MNFADQIIRFLESLKLTVKLPNGIRVMNPYQEPEIKQIVAAFYNKYYADNHERTLILAINPGRLGAGATGIPFTDTRRLEEVCGIDTTIHPTHEPSSVFVYEMIAAYGGAEKFYHDYFIGSVSPLGFVKENARGNWVNFNYYDNPDVARLLEPFIVSSLQEELRMPLNHNRCICWGTGKNFHHLTALNKTYGFFKEIIPLEHPRFIMQYRSKQKEAYIEKYLQVLQ
jgi:hypothetical protein